MLYELNNNSFFSLNIKFGNHDRLILMSQEK